MAGKDLDQDAIAAQWEASLDSEDPAAAAARRSHQGHLLQHSHPMDVEAEEAAQAAEAEAAAAQSAPNQPLFHCVTTNIDLILQLLHAVKLEKKEQVSAARFMSQLELFVCGCPFCCSVDSPILLCVVAVRVSVLPFGLVVAAPAVSVCRCVACTSLRRA